MKYRKWDSKTKAKVVLEGLPEQNPACPAQRGLPSSAIGIK